MTLDTTTMQDTPSAADSPTEQAMDAFVQMSSLLTGFNASIIAPTLDPTDLKTTLFETAQEHTGEVFEQLLANYQAQVAKVAPGKTVSEMTEAQKVAIGRALLANDGQEDDSNRSATARAVMKAWYLGSWYQPFDHAGSAAGSQVVISDQAYIQGLAWKVMQSHAMGNSTFTFGYWQEDPPELSAFTGNSAPAGTGSPNGGAQ